MLSPGRPVRTNVLLLATTLISIATASTSTSDAASPTTSASTEPSSAAAGWSAWSYLPDLWGFQEVPSIPSPPQFAFDLQSLPHLTDNASIHPWSQPPQCLAVARLNEPLCVFTQKAFGGGRGISIVTVPSHAAQFAEWPLFNGSGGGIPVEVNGPPHKGLVEERVLPDAGRGLAATTSLPPGEFLYAHTPLLLLHPALKMMEAAGADALRWAAVQALPPASQDLFWSMVGKPADARDELADRIDVNTFNQLFHGLPYLIANPEIARLNHDCRPNVISSFDPAGMAQYLHVIRAVAPEEELTLSYVDVLQPTARRQALLLQDWGFRCSCAACRRPAALAQESDDRGQEIRELLAALEADHLGSGGATLAAPRAIAMAERLLLLVDLERVEAKLAAAVTHLALAHSSACHYELAVAHGRKALLYGMMEWGYEAESTSMVRDLVRDVTAHWSWAMRMSGDASARQACAAANSKNAHSGEA